MKVIVDTGSTTPEIMRKFFGTQPEIKTDGAAVTTDSSPVETPTVEAKDRETCHE